MARYALVIGIGENQLPLKSLTKTVGDAREIAQVLREHGDFHVELLKIGGKTSIPIVTEGSAEANFEILVKCKFPNQSQQTST